MPNQYTKGLSDSRGSGCFLRFEFLESEEGVFDLMLVRTIPQALRRAEERITGRKSKTEEFPSLDSLPFILFFMSTNIYLSTNVGK